jgi:ATP-dependent helicase/nuclease subunit A
VIFSWNGEKLLRGIVKFIDYELLSSYYCWQVCIFVVYVEYKSEICKALDVETSCFIFASAGSGKTSILVNRFIKSLFFGLKPQEILCVTFTNAAVFEMQSRISEILMNLYINENQYTEIFLKNIIGLKEIAVSDIKKAEGLFFTFQDALPTLKILTIHAFCQNLLQQFPLEADILPNFSIVDADEAGVLMRKARNNILSQTSEETLNSLSKKISVHTFEDFINQLHSIVGKFIILFDNYVSVEGYEKFLQNKIQLKSEMDYSNEQKEFIEKFYKNENLSEKFLTQTGAIRKKILSGNNEVAKEIAEILHSNNQNEKKRNTIEKTCSFLEIVHSILKEYDRLKKEENVLDFNDVLRITEFLLTKSCAKEFIVSKICSQVKSIMIDEAQDLSPMQWRLITLLVDDMFSDVNSDKVIFVVGDIKQSIYRFQGANYKLFSKFYEYCNKTFAHLGKSVNTVYLNTCYRTLSEILENVDKVFLGEIAKFAFDQNSISYKQHVANRNRCDTDQSSAFAMIEFSDEDDIAEWVIQHINTQKSKDILFLTRSRNEFTLDLTRRLLNAGLDVAPSDKIKLIDNLLILDVLAVADVCISEQNDYALACILKSPYFFAKPLTNEDLFPMCHNRLTTVMEKLKHFYPDRYEYILEIKKHYNCENSIKFFYYLISIVRKFSRSDDDVSTAFMDNVLKFASRKSNKIPDFLDYFRNCDIFVYNKNTSKDKIRISTIHGAKGTEADVVYLLNFSLKADKTKMKMIFTENAELFNTSKEDFVFFIKPSKNDSFEEINEIVESEILEEEKELLRLLYVAMTRARNSLYVLGKNEDRSVYNLIQSSLTKSTDQ